MVERLKNKLSRNKMLLLVSVIIGLVTGCAAIILKYTVHYIQQFLQSDHNFTGQEYLIAISPMLGILLTVLFIEVVLKGRLGRGISNILYEITNKRSIVHKDKIYSHGVTSALTVGFGGSAGLEAPIVVTGSAIGSNIAKKFGLGYKDRTILLAAGAAAGISAVFNAPITGVIFALEVILVTSSISQFIPIILASVVGALLSKIVFNEDILFVFKLQENFNYLNVPYYIILGILCGVISLYYSKVNTILDNLQAKFKEHKYTRAVAGGLLLSFLYLLFPTIFGEGYHSVKLLANGQFDKVFNNSIVSGYLSNEWFFIFFIGIIALIKVIATAITISSGGNGGNFAPSIFVGAYTGYFFSALINKINITHLPLGNFTLVAMAGILSGVFYAPFTGIFLIAEITGGYELILPLMLVSAISYTFTKHFQPYSMDTKKWAQKGKIFTSDKDLNVLKLLRTSKLIENDFIPVSISGNLGDIVAAIKCSNRNSFPVLNSARQLLGIIDLDEVRELMFRQELYTTMTVKELMLKPDALVKINESMMSAVKKFDVSKHWILPVVDENNIYIGFVSKSNIFNKYRRLIKEI